MSAPLTPNAAVNTQTLLRTKYPGMLPQEAQLFDAWFQQHHTEFDSADFNVRVGRGIDPGPAYTQQVRDTAVLNSQFRIDALLTRQGVTWIVEVKLRLTPLAIGQLVSYNVLWKQGDASRGNVALVALTADASIDMMAVCQQLNITIITQSN